MRVGAQASVIVYTGDSWIFNTLGKIRMRLVSLFDLCVLIQTQWLLRRSLNIASVRILRLAFGTASSLWFSQAVTWDMSFIAPVMTCSSWRYLYRRSVERRDRFYRDTVADTSAGLLLLPTLLNQPMVGLLLLVLALYWSFYFTAKGGSALVGTLLTVGIAMTTAVGTVSVDAVLTVNQGVVFGAVAGVCFVWVAHAVIPDSLAQQEPGATVAKPPAAPKPNLTEARWNAFRSLAIVLPIAVWFLLSSASTAYVPVMLKVASMGQQASNDATRVAGRSLIMSTLIGGAGAIIGWQILRIVPTLSVYTLLIALGALVAGPKIFKNKGMHPEAGTWSYAYLTMVVILAPAVMDGIGGAAAGANFIDRLIMFALTTVYAVVAVYVFDAFRSRVLKNDNVE